MSRYSDCDDWDNNPSQYLWASNYERALTSKRGQKMLGELREALLTMPKRELISGAMCTVNPANRAKNVYHSLESGHWSPRDSFLAEIAEKGEGVCAIGAYAWHKLVKKGVDADEAWAQIPTMLESDGNALYETAEYARQTFGVALTLAWDIAYRNDEQFADMTPAARWEAMLRWVELQILETVGTQE
jgi:hypothetical protein